MIFGSFLSNTDMQSGSPSFGTPESAIGVLATGQLMRRFGLPWRGGGALNASQTVDAQAAYESLMTFLPTFLAGTNFVMHSAGWLEGGLVSCYEKFIVDIELLRELRHMFGPLEIDEDSLAFSAHQEVGAGGHFLGAVHTLERFRECFYRPLLSSTENFDRWTRKGARDTTARAGEIWRSTLESYEEPPMDAAIRAGARGVRRAPAGRARRLTRRKGRGRSWPAGPTSRPRSGLPEAPFSATIVAGGEPLAQPGREPGDRQRVDQAARGPREPADGGRGRAAVAAPPASAAPARCRRRAARSPS